MTEFDVLGSIEGCPGWHVNVPKAGMSDTLAAYVVTPAEPVRIFAGDVGPDYALTAFLRFDSEAQALEALST